MNVFIYLFISFVNLAKINILVEYSKLYYKMKFAIFLKIAIRRNYKLTIYIELINKSC